MSIKKYADVTQPVVLMFPWLGATESAISKYVNIYKHLIPNCEMVVKEVHLLDFLWPAAGLKNCKRFLIDLENQMFSCDRPLIIHSMSVGCYFYSLMLHVLKYNPRELSRIRKNIILQVIDSPVTGNLNEMAAGISTTSTNNRLGQSFLKQFTLFYFASTKFCTVKMYNKLIDILKYGAMEVPSLILSSLDDPLGNPESYKHFVDSWSRRNIDVTSKLFADSAHAQHFKYHKEEYENLLSDLLHKSLKDGQIISKL